MRFSAVGVGAGNSWELLNVGTGLELRASARAVSILLLRVSPGLEVLTHGC